MIQTRCRPRLALSSQDQRDLFHILAGGGQQALLGDLADPAQPRVAMAVELFGIGEASFDGFFSSFVDPFSFRREAVIMDLLFMFLPYVAGDDLYMVTTLGAFIEAGTLGAD